MKSGKNNRHNGMRAAVVSMACALALTGCSGLPFDLPFELPNMPELPFELPDLSELPNPFAALGTGTSVEEARAAKAQERTSQLSSEDLVEAGKLTVGINTSTASAPFAIESSSGSLYGIDVDVASALADDLGLEVHFVKVDGIDSALSAGTCDVVMDVSSATNTTATIVGSYYESCPAFFAVGDMRVATLEELSGKTVAVQDGSVSQGALSRSNLSMEQKTVINLNDAFEALHSGEVDFVLCDAYPGAYLAAAYEGASFVGALSTPESYGIAVSTEKVNVQSAVQQSLDAIANNGVMDVVRSVWVGGMPAISTEQVIQGIQIEGGTSTAESAEQDGTTAGANAVVLF